MSTLAFFPWLRLDAPMTVDSFELLPFERGKCPGKDRQQQDVLDAVLHPYMEVLNRPVSRATLLRSLEKELTEDLTEDDRAAAFRFAEHLAFSGLAARQFFFGGDRYLNRDTFPLYVQAFSADNPRRGVSLSSRRRDGRNLTHNTGSVFGVIRPPHVLVSGSTRIDVPFLTAIRKASDAPEFERLDEAIFWYLFANTDSDAVDSAAEVNFMMNAFEQIFGCRRGKEDDVVSGFLAALIPEHNVPPEESKHVRRDRTGKGQTLREIWIRDFFQLRGEYAHGNRQSRRPQQWNQIEHLLLGAFVFIPVVKNILASRGYYRLTTEDLFDISCFEPLLTCDDFWPETKDFEKQLPWNQIRWEMRFRSHFPTAAERAAFAAQPRPVITFEYGRGGTLEEAAESEEKSDEKEAD